MAESLTSGVLFFSMIFAPFFLDAGAHYERRKYAHQSKTRTEQTRPTYLDPNMQT